jgi:hypothetical protein
MYRQSVWDNSRLKDWAAREKDPEDLGTMYVPVNYKTRASLTGDIEWDAHIQ